MARRRRSLRGRRTVVDDATGEGTSLGDPRNVGESCRLHEGERLRSSFVSRRRASVKEAGEEAVHTFVRRGEVDHVQ
jgi:hypothetical protein